MVNGDSDSDSDRLNGMEGIEVGGGIEIESEVRDNVQGNLGGDGEVQGNVQGSLGDGSKAKSDISSGIKFQGMTTSPRKTRSGKVIRDGDK
jgi:hypothetical protein